MGEPHGLQRHHVADRFDSGQVFAGFENNFGDTNLLRFRQRIAHQGVGAVAALLGFEVIGFVEEQRIDLLFLDEFDDLDGFRQLDVGLVDPITDDLVELSLTRDFGGLSRGTTLTFPVAGNEHARAYLPLIPTTAEVIATDAHGRPAILRRQMGRGALLLCAYPLEHMAAALARVNPDATVALYGALATHAGVRRAVTVEDPDVACDMLVHRDGTRYAVISSHADEALTVKPALGAAGAHEPPLGLTPLGETEIVDRVTLPPFGVQVLKITEG